MELDGAVHKAFLRAMGEFCFREIKFHEQVHLSSKLVLFVDECTQYEYHLEDLINRCDESLYTNYESATQTEVCLVDAESQTGSQTDTPGVDEDQQGQGTFEDVKVKEELDTDSEDRVLAVDVLDDGAHDDSDAESITKVIPTSPSSLINEPHRKTRKEKVACPLCPAKFSEKLLAEKHLKDSHDIGNFYICSICQDVCMSNAALIEHMNEHHADTEKDSKRKTRRRKQQPQKMESKIKPAKKIKQGKEAKKEKKDIGEKKIKKMVIKANKELDEIFTEDLSGKRKRAVKKIVDEDFVPDDELSSQVKCAECGKQYKSKRALRRHFSIIHDMQEYQCEICGKNFTGKESLYHHRRGIHMDLKPYKCPEAGCDKSFNFNHSLRLHRLKHSGSRPHQCSACGKTYLTAYHLKVHSQAAHSDKKNFACKTCDKLFSYSTSLKMHEATHEKALRVNCQQCDKTFVNAQALKYHMMSKHTEPGHFPCDECDKVYKSEFLLRTHKRRHTTDGSRFMCDLCGRQFMYKSALEMHKAVHKDEKSFVCKICDKSFKTYPTLYSHQFVHKEDSPFQCGQCGKAFKTKERCKAHEKRHSGLKPFECQICHHCFPDNGGLSKHMRTVHCAVKKFVCNICGKATSRADNLRVHMKVHSKGGDYKPKGNDSKQSKHFEREYSPLDMPLLVPLTVDESTDNFTPKKLSLKHDIKPVDVYHENSRDSFASNSSQVHVSENNHYPSSDNYHHNMPHFTTLDSAQISVQSDDQALPLNLQQCHNTSESSASYPISQLDSHGGLPLVAATDSVERHGVADSQGSSTNPSPVPPNAVSVTSLQPAHYMYAWPYVYPATGIQPQPGASSGFFQQ